MSPVPTGGGYGAGLIRSSCPPRSATRCWNGPAVTGDAQAALQAAAVLAAPADEATLAAVTGLGAERSRAGLTQALACGLLAEDGRLLVSFRHALACQAVDEAVPGPDRRAMHLRAGQALEQVQPPPLARLARHFREAGETVRWCRYGEQAADLALVTGDGATAAALLYDLVTEGGLPAADVARLTRKIPFATLAEPARYRALAGALRSVLDGGLQPRVEAELRLQLGRVLVVMSDWGAGRTELERAIPNLGHDPAEAARVMIYLGWPLEPSWPASRHRSWLRRAARVMAALTPPVRQSLGMDRATALLMLGEEEGWAEAARIPADAPTARERLRITRGNLNIGDQAMVWGRYAEARRRLATALELAETHQYPRVRDEVLSTSLHLDWLTGTWDGLGQRASALAGSDGLALAVQLEAVLVAGLLHAAGGQVSQAEEHLQSVIGEIGRRGAVQYFAEPAGALARLRLAEGQLGDALAITEEPVGVVTGKGIWVWATEIAPVRVTALAAAGRADEAADLVAVFARGLRGRNAPGAEGRSRGVPGDPRRNARRSAARGRAVCQGRWRLEGAAAAVRGTPGTRAAGGLPAGRRPARRRAEHAGRGARRTVRAGGGRRRRPGRPQPAHARGAGAAGVAGRPARLRGQALAARARGSPLRQRGADQPGNRPGPVPVTEHRGHPAEIGHAQAQGVLPHRAGGEGARGRRRSRRSSAWPALTTAPRRAPAEQSRIWVIASNGSPGRYLAAAAEQRI